MIDHSAQVELSVVYKTAKATRATEAAVFMPVTVPRRASKNTEVAVCVKATFGQLARHRLVEWFELQRLLGVSHVGVYATPAIHPDTRRILAQYAATPLVELRTIKYVDGGSGHGHQQIVGSVTIQDCVYRHIYTHTFVGVYDFDEVHLICLLCKSKSGATLTMAIILSILDRFVIFFRCCKHP